MENLRNNKLNPAQAEVESAGVRFKHLVVSLRNQQTISEVRETPAVWTAIQHDLAKKLARGDEVSIIAADGNTLADRCVVLRAEGGHVWLSAPVRMISLEPVGLWTDGTHEVWPNGTGFSIRNCRDGVVDGHVFPSVEAAKQEIVKRQPSRAA